MDDIAQGGRTEITPSLAAGVYIMSGISAQAVLSDV